MDEARVGRGGALVRRYRADLLATLEAYLAHDCNMNATARAIYAHRHTVAYRLERVKELTGLDPSAGDARERLGLGSKAVRIPPPGPPPRSPYSPGGTRAARPYAASAVDPARAPG